MSFWLPSQRHISILDLKTSKEAIVSSLSPPIYRNNRQGNPGIQGPQENEGLGLPKYSELKSQGSTVSGAGAEWFWTTPARRTGRWLEWIELDFGCGGGGGIGCFFRFTGTQEDNQQSSGSLPLVRSTAHFGHRFLEGYITKYLLANSWQR